MLVLCRKAGENLVIGDEIVVSVLAIRGGRIRLGIDAPPSVHVRREELKPFELSATPESIRTSQACCNR